MLVRAPPCTEFGGRFQITAQRAGSSPRPPAGAGAYLLQRMIMRETNQLRSLPRRSTLQPQFLQVHPLAKVSPNELDMRTGGNRAVQQGQTTAKAPRLVLPAKKYTTTITTTAIRTHAQRSIGAPLRGPNSDMHLICPRPSSAGQ